MLLDTHKQWMQNCSNDDLRPTRSDLIRQFVELKNMFVWVSALKCKWTPGLHLPTEKGQNNPKTIKTVCVESLCVEIKYNYKLPTTLIFLSLRCTTWLKQKAPLRWPSSTAAAGQWKTSLTLSSLASISTTSVSTSSISALENKNKGRFRHFLSRLWFLTL